MRKLKAYIETTLFNFYFDKDREAHAATVTFFEDIAAGKYEAFTSDYVVNELEKTQDEKREKMIALIERYGITVLGLDDEAEQLADIYVEQGIIPLRYRTDGVHIAVAAVNDLNMIVSMNFEHIVKRKTKIETGNINTSNGYRIVEICTPMEVNENENS
jgi:desulfoferrodoxin (superoxide reductase-like protein)